MVLLAHDDPALRRVCRALLVEAGAEVSELEGPRSLAKALRGSDVEALVLCWALSWSPPQELIGAVRDRSPSARVIVLGQAPLPEALSLGVQAAVTQDVAGLARLPEALAAGRRAAGLLEAAGIAAFRLGPEGELLQANPRFEALDALEQVREALTEQALDRRLKVGEAWFQLTARPSGQGMDGVLVDITEAENLGQELSELRYQRQASPPDSGQSLEYAHTVAHDLQAPLRSALLRLDQLEQGRPEALDQARAQLQSMQRMVRGLLPDVDEEPTHLGGGTEAELVLDEALANLDALIRDKQAVVEREPLPRVAVPPTELLQLLQNLVGNALKYGQDPPVVRVSAQRQGEQVVFSVRDNGPGISQDDAERLFQAWQHGPSGGHGLGLAICKRLVESRGGWIAVDSGAGGSTFQFALPLHQ